MEQRAPRIIDPHRHLDILHRRRLPLLMPNRRSQIIIAHSISSLSHTALARSGLEPYKRSKLR